MIRPFYKGQSLIEIIIERLKMSKTPIIVATTTNPRDDQIEEIALKNSVNFFRGSETDVLQRFIETAEFFNVNKIIRVCADNPLLDINSIIEIKYSFDKANVDYWCYSKKDFTPTIKTHYGFWVEGVTLNALYRVHEQTKDPFYREHVTNYIYSNSESFSIHHKKIDPRIEKSSNIRLTIDTQIDFDLVQMIYYELLQNKIKLSAEEIVKFVNLHPEWISIMEKEINKNIK